MSDLDKIAAGMAKNGITISVNHAPGASFRGPSEATLIADAAKRAGIYYEPREDGQQT